jgi:hypothetical protein
MIVIATPLSWGV